MQERTLMKKYVLLVAGGALALIMASLYAASEVRTKAELSSDMLTKVLSFDAKVKPQGEQQLRDLILNAQDLYSPEEFKDFINTEDKDGWNIIMSYVANGQASQLAWLLDLLKKMYGNDQRTLFDITYEKDKDGRSALYLGVMREQVLAVDTLLKKTFEMFGTNKDYYYTYTQSPDDLTARTPLMQAAYLNAYEIMKSILKYEVMAFGPGAPRLQRNLRKAYALADSKGKQLIQQYHRFPITKGRMHDVAA